MLKTKDYKYYEMKLNKDGRIILTDIILKTGDTIGLPISFSETKLDNYLRIVKDAIKDKIINDYWATEYSCVFNVMENHNYTYNQWKYLIEYAKKNNINFFVNIVEEYTPQEMENYIEKFVRGYKSNRKHFLFHDDNFKLEYNPLISEEDPFTYIGSCSSYVIKEFDENAIDEYINKQRRKLLNQFDFVLKDGNNFSEVEIDNVKKVIDYIKEKYPNNIFDISFSSNFQYYTKEQFSKLLQLEKYIKDNYNNKYELEFLACDTVINKKQILNANSKIDEVVNLLKHSTMSPYEKILYVHKLLTEKKFYDEPFNSTLARDVYTILNSDNVVSIGYAMLMNTIFKELKDENIKVTNELIDLNNGSFSCVNCVYLKDEKYGINGYYKIDIIKNNGTNEINRFMIPSSDFNSICDEYGYVDSGPGVSCGNIMRNCHYFQRYNDDNSGDYLSRILSWHENIDNLNNNTLEFLNNESKEKVLTKVINDKKTHPTFYILDEIDECVKNTSPIPLEATYNAIETVASNYYGLDSYESRRYANNVIKKSIFNSLFQCRRSTCKNDFAKVSLQIEKGNLSLNSKINRRK